MNDERLLANFEKIADAPDAISLVLDQPKAKHRNHRKTSPLADCWLRTAGPAIRAERFATGLSNPTT